MQTPNTFRGGPDARGHFGIYGGRFVAETLMPLVLAVEAAYNAAQDDPSFQAELDYYLEHYVGRPSPFYFAERLTRHFGGAKLYFKRDELNHTGAHKINNVLGQILLARRMGKRRIIAETGAGQHGVATATACALFDLPCVVYMGATDIERQKPNVFRMKLLGAEVVPVHSGTATLKDAMNEALRDWVAHVEDTFYVIGTVAGPHPYPAMVRDFQSVIGRETREQMMKAEGRLPDTLVACIGGGSNAMGLFHPFLDEPSVRDDRGRGRRPRHRDRAARRLAERRRAGRPARQPHLSAAGRRRPDPATRIRSRPGSIIPGSAPSTPGCTIWAASQYVSITDREALEAFQLCSRQEGIIPALEPAHALAHVAKIAPTLPRDHLIVMNMCGRGDKDIFAVADHLGVAAVSRIERRFAKLREEGRAGLVIYLTAGDPDPDTSLALFAGPRRGRRRPDRDRHAVLRPDGRRPGRSRRPGSARLKQGMTLRKTLALVRELRERDDDDARSC